MVEKWNQGKEGEKIRSTVGKGNKYVTNVMAAK